MGLVERENQRQYDTLQKTGSNRTTYQIMKVIAFLTITALFIAGSGQAAASAYQPCSWEKQIVAACLVLEAADQGEMGMRGVASVILNRADGNHSKVMRVVKKPYAFSALNTATTGRTGSKGFASHVQKASRDRLWRSALQIVDELYTHNWRDVTQGADHYVRTDIRPSWVKSMAKTTTIGSHAFYTTYN